MEDSRDPWEKFGPHGGRSILRGMLEGVLLWIAVTLVLWLLSGGARGSDSLGDFVSGLLTFQPLHIGYVLPLALFLNSRHRAGRALGLLLQWALGFLLTLFYCSHAL